MKLTEAIDIFVADQRQQGRFNSPATERAYRSTLELLAEEVSNRDPAKVGRQDIKRTLARWQHPNTQGTRRAHMVSFFKWTLEEGIRKDNPAEQTRRPRRRKPQVYRLTRDEVLAMLRSARGRRERFAIFTGFLVGLRSQELRGLQGRHFRRPGWVWVSSDIAKGRRERWVPVLSEYEPVWREIAELADDDFVLPAQRWRDPGINRLKVDLRKHPCSPQAVYYLVKRVGQRAGIPAPVHPHLMRHGFGDHLARFAGVRNAQFLLGHSDIGTTEGYLDAPTLDELRASTGGFGYGLVPTPALYAVNPAQGADRNRTGDSGESISRAAIALSPVLRSLWLSPTLRDVARSMA